MYKRLGLGLDGRQRKRNMNEHLAEAIANLNIESRKLQELSASSGMEEEIKQKLIEMILIAYRGLEQMK
jgi:hypothetical protein